MSLIPWINRTELLPSLNFPRLFRDGDFFFDNRWVGGEMTVPAVNVCETKKAFELEVAAPGMKKKDFKVEVKDGHLFISSETKTEKEEKGEDYTRKEFSFNSFCRSFMLPENVMPENVKATYTDGILKITVPKAKVEEKGKPALTVAVS
jgi:HSP20 family protein